ncbi:hypothetical protein MUP59_03635, partial [Candidatus Bathyarchaeota archaeon]|nr:hypothetical protein [Candidatus Bathyarchaeota archaeon]
MDKNLLDSLNRSGYKGGNIDDAMQEMCHAKDNAPVLIHANTRRRAIVESYMSQANESIKENLMKRECVLSVQARDADLIPAIQCMFIINGYECDT